ncbi:hypothetical protein LQW54_007791 [Pestalotiopsis sp. IQ-011]
MDKHQISIVNTHDGKYNDGEKKKASASTTIVASKLTSCMRRLVLSKLSSLWGAVSILEHLEMISYPVFLLNEQIRIASGLFDLAQTLIYSELRNFKHASSAQVDQQPMALDLKYGIQVGYDIPLVVNQLTGLLIKYEYHFEVRISPTDEIGYLPIFEQAAQIESQYPGVALAPKDKALPVFLHCSHSDYGYELHERSFRFNQLQNTAAVQLVQDLLQNKHDKSKPSDIVAITPYRANLAFSAKPWPKLRPVLRPQRRTLTKVAKAKSPSGHGP